MAAILLALRGAHVATTPLVGGSLGLTSVSVVVLWLSVGFLVLAWAYLLAGALDAHPAVVRREDLDTQERWLGEDLLVRLAKNNADVGDPKTREFYLHPHFRQNSDVPLHPPHEKVRYYGAL